MEAEEEMSVHQLPDGRWICKFPAGTIKDQPKKIKEYFGRGTEGEAAARRRNMELGIGAAKVKSSSPLFEALAAEYLQTRGREMTPSTLSSLQYKVSRVLVPAIGHLHAHEVDHQALANFVHHRRTKAGIKDRTIRDDLAYIGAIMKFALERGRIVSNPAAGYRRPRNDAEKVRPPNQAEFNAILQHAAPHIKRAMQIAYYTGCRPGLTELFSLTWTAVDFFNRSITITSAKKGGLAQREIPITQKFYDLLASWKKEDEEAEYRGGYLVHYHGKRVERIKTGWDAAKRRAGITRRIRNYDLRHMTATEMLAAGVPMKTVSEILGHASIVQTADTYSHVRSPEKQSAVDKL